MVFGRRPGFFDLNLNVLKSLILILIAIIATGCGDTLNVTQPGSTDSRTVTDDLGRRVVLPKRVERAISLAPSITEMVFAAGAGDRLVGVTTYCNYPPAALSIQKVGDTQTPNIETIIALKPDVVLVSTASQLEAFMQTLEQQNISVYVIGPKTLDDIFRGLVQLGGIFDTPAHATATAESMLGRIAEVEEEVKGKPRVSVFVQISKDPLYTIGKDSFLTSLIEKAGGESVTKDVATAYPTISKETAAAMDPEAIILSDSEDNAGPNDVFKNSRAVRSGRVYRINADIISRPGPRLVDALEQIAAKLHPEK